MNAVDELAAGAGGVKNFAIGAGILAGIGIVAYVGWKAYKAAGNITGAIKGTAHALNPVNPDNIFATGANKVVSALAGRETSLGSFIYDLVHPSSPTSSPVSGQGTPPSMSVQDLRNERAKIQAQVNAGIGDTSAMQDQINALDDFITSGGM